MREHGKRVITDSGSNYGKMHDTVEPHGHAHSHLDKIEAHHLEGKKKHTI
jgi:hypothetical protein